jgi:DNA-binding MarR family transcriptional regulator
MRAIKTIDFEELKQYESFNSIEEMDKSIYRYIDYIRHEVSKSVIDVLLCLGRASLRCIGISFMKQSTIAKETGYSRQTINKALKTLESLGIVDSVRTKTKSGRPSVKVIRILPFCLETLQQHFTSKEIAESNGDNELKLVEGFEPIKDESTKQENNYKDNQSIIEKVAKLSTDLHFDGNLKNIVKYLALKLGEMIKKGLEIKNFGAYCEKVLANEVHKYAIKKQLEERQRQKAKEESRQFNNFVLKYFGESFENLGDRSQREAIRMYQESKSLRQKIVFYNWLEA